MSGHDCDVIVIGGGISGLANAWWLAREGLSVQVWEAGDCAGGKIKSSRHDGYLTESAASMVLNFRPEVAELMSETGLDKVKSSRMPEAEANRYLLHDGELKALPMRLGAMLASPLWSISGKLRLMLEPFILTSGAMDESVSDFVSRRLGREMLEKAMEPFIAGTLAADPDQTSATAALPRLTALEKRYGSITAGILVNRLLGRRSATVTETFSFNGGIGTLVDTLARAPGITMRYGYKAEELVKKNDGWCVSASTPRGERILNAQHVIVAAPAPVAAKLVKPLNHSLAELVDGISYASIAVLHAGFDRSAISHRLDGNGFLAPKGECSALTGNLWMSSLFSGRAPAGKTLLTSYLGGSRVPHALDWSDERLLDETLQSLKPLLGLKGEPEMVRINRHRQALPVYHGAYQNRIQNIDAQLKLLPGLHLEANYKGGVSVRDRLARGQIIATRIMSERKQFSHKHRGAGKLELLAEN